MNLYLCAFLFLSLDVERFSFAMPKYLMQFIVIVGHLMNFAKIPVAVKRKVPKINIFHKSMLGLQTL